LELGGNDRVNAIFEAGGILFDSIKPTSRSDSQIRLNFVRQKYQSRNFYDSAAYKETMEPRKDPMFLDDKIFDNFDDDVFADPVTATPNLFGNCIKKKLAQNSIFLSQMIIDEGEERGFREDDTFAQFTKDRSALNLKSTPSRAHQEIGMGEYGFLGEEDMLTQTICKDSGAHEPESEPPHVPTLDIEVLEAEKAQAVAKEDYLRAAKIKKQIDLLTDTRKEAEETQIKKKIDLLAGTRKRQSDVQRLRPQYNSFRVKRRNHLEMGSPSTKNREVVLESLDSMCSFAEEEFEIPKDSTASERQQRRSLNSYLDEEKGEKVENISMHVQPVVQPPRRINSMARTIQSAPQPNEVDDYGLVAKGKNGIHSKSIRSRKTVKMASYKPAFDVSIDEFGFGVIAASEMPAPRRSSIKSHQARRSSHTSRKGERRPSSMASADVELDKEIHDTVLTPDKRRRGERRPSSMVSEDVELDKDCTVLTPDTRRSSRRFSSCDIQETPSTPSSRSRRSSLCMGGRDSLDKEIHQGSPSARRLSRRFDALDASATSSSSPTAVTETLLQKRERKKESKSKAGNSELSPRPSSRSVRSSNIRSSRKQLESTSRVMRTHSH
jgi:hypothetical protein